MGPEREGVETERDGVGAGRDEGERFCFASWAMVEGVAKDHAKWKEIMKGLSTTWRCHENDDDELHKQYYRLRRQR